MKNMKYLYIEIYFFLFSPFSKLRIKQMIIIIIFFVIIIVKRLLSRGLESGLRCIRNILN